MLMLIYIDIYNYDSHQFKNNDAKHLKFSPNVKITLLYISEKYLKNWSLLELQKLLEISRFWKILSNKILNVQYKNLKN